jgi:predicted heme/steroid binding protein
MKFFRDLSRYKARKRLYGNSAALIPLLFGKEDNVDLLVDPGSDDFTMTIEQLSEMNGSTNETPVYLSVKGNIYDVSSARAMYGPGGGYHGFAGRDATRAFATGCLETECMVSSIDGLTESELKEIDRWVELYHNHDKYTYVGRLMFVDPVDSIVTNEMRNESVIEL